MFMDDELKNKLSLFTKEKIRPLKKKKEDIDKEITLNNKAFWLSLDKSKYNAIDLLRIWSMLKLGKVVTNPSEIIYKGKNIFTYNEGPFFFEKYIPLSVANIFDHIENNYDLGKDKEKKELLILAKNILDLECSAIKLEF